MVKSKWVSQTAFVKASTQIVVPWFQQSRFQSFLSDCFQEPTSSDSKALFPCICFETCHWNSSRPGWCVVCLWPIKDLWFHKLSAHTEDHKLLSCLLSCLGSSLRQVCNLTSQAPMMEVFHWSTTTTPLCNDDFSEYIQQAHKQKVRAQRWMNAVLTWFAPMLKSDSKKRRSTQTRHSKKAHNTEPQFRFVSVTESYTASHAPGPRWQFTWSNPLVKEKPWWNKKGLLTYIWSQWLWSMSFNLFGSPYRIREGQWVGPFYIKNDKSKLKQKHQRRAL